MVNKDYYFLGLTALSSGSVADTGKCRNATCCLVCKLL